MSGHLDSLVDYQGRDGLTVDLQAVPTPAPVELTVGKLAKIGFALKRVLALCFKRGGVITDWVCYQLGNLVWLRQFHNLCRILSQFVSSPFTISFFSFLAIIVFSN